MHQPNNIASHNLPSVILFLHRQVTMTIIVRVMLHLAICFLTSETSAAESSLDNFDLLAVVKKVNHGLECIGDVVKDSVLLQRESLTNQKESKDTLTALEKLPDLMVQLKTQLGDQSDIISSLTKELAARLNAEEYYTENKDLKSKLANEVSKVVDLENRLNQSLTIEEELFAKEKQLNESVKDLERFLMATKNESEQNNMKVHDLENELKQALERIEKLREKEEICDKQDESPGTKVEESCSLAGEENIRKQVQEFNRTKDWNPLFKVLKKELNHDSAAYKELQELAYSTTPMNYIGWGGMMELSDVLVNCGGAINVADGGGHTMLHGVAVTGNLTMAQWLLDRGANTDSKNWEDWTPLMNAAYFGCLEVVRCLVQAGASINNKGTYGRTALQLAVNEGNTEVVEYLTQSLL